jgi:hypothetical protein
MKIMVRDGKTYEVRERITEIPYWTHYGTREVQIHRSWDIRECSGGQGVGAARSPKGEDSAP